MAGVQVKFRWDDRAVLSQLSNIEKQEWDNIVRAVEDVRQDIETVGKANAPRKTGKLENSIRSTRRIFKGKSINIGVSAQATNGGFDYAQWTHDSDYNLGQISRMKSGGRSRFGKSFRVGKDYLQGILDSLDDKYLDHIEKAVNKAIESNN